jgi:hypothetical protein
MVDDRTEFDASIANECALKVATFNANHLPAEPFQISPPPTISSTDAHTWQWYEQFHLQIPLDNLEDHAYAVVELVRKVLSTAKAGAVEDTAAPSANVIAWTKITLDRDIINSETKTLTFYMPPMVDESIGTATAGAGAGQSQPTVHSTMEVELMISRRLIILHRGRFWGVFRPRSIVINCDQLRLFFRTSVARAKIEADVDHN